MAEYLRGKWWWIAYPGPNGGVKREPTKILNTGKDSRKLAEACYAKRLTEIAEGKFLGIKHINRIKFKEFAIIFIDNHLKVNTKNWKTSYGKALVATNENGLVHYFGEKYLDEIKPFDIEEFKQFRIQKVKPQTINQDLMCLKTMLNKAVLWEKLTKNPMEKVCNFKAVSKRDRFFTKEELKLIINYANGIIRQITLFAVTTGMRASEIINLKWTDIDFNKNLLCIDDQKNKKIDYIPIKHIRNLLMKIKRESSSPYVFNKPTGEPFHDYNQISNLFKHIVRDLKIVGGSFHTLRHTFASHLVMSGIDLYRVSKLMRHSSIKMTERYAHLSKVHLEQAVEVLALQFDIILQSVADNTKSSQSEIENEKKEFNSIVSDLELGS